MNKANECTCPSGDGSLRWPCPAHPAVEQAGGDERAADEKPRATRCPDCGEHDLMPGDLCACGYETDPATGYACSECDGSGEGCVVEACRECDGSGWFVTPDQARAALAQPSPKCATCNDSGQIVVSGPHYQGEFQPPEYETEPCDMCAQPSPAQAEQAEAERPEVVARVVHSNPVVLGQCGPLNANDELMTVAQHAASVARWAEMFNRVEQERDAALVAQAGQVPDILTEDDMKWLRRFAECCEDSDAGGHDLPKAAVKQLVQIGALRHSGPGRQETTAFGDWLLDTTPVQGGFTNE
ncbi:TPA: hypothetical protein ACRMT2_001626 [Pseudomonas aeruginosa]|uniref:hypothetical protein n=1 Tax=Pseudomonas aeruginosa TaxID=287 RepID=UPI001A27FE0A|nr:hypothetical protein [Pseudomonas aeruginosa]MCO2725794.1 hypothetical protein [Pseudomonas aeruginosa]MCO2728042.1 hypothetical protein [Pseudomonas aeruginosa]HCU2082089.1 hypothetical protein [Pseudomonas aeruginosa]